MRIIAWIVVAAAAMLCDVTHAKPRHRPRNVTAEITDNTSVLLRWSAPRLPAGCAVRRYLVRLKHAGYKRSRTWKVDGARTSLGLHDLLPHTEYSLRVVAMTCEGKGAPTRWLHARTGGGGGPAAAAAAETREAATADSGGGGSVKAGLTEEASPGKPTHARTRTYSDSVVVSWRPPDDAGSVLVRGYMIGYGEGVPDVHWQYVGADATNVTVRGLKPATQYLISIRAFNHYGKGPVIYDLIYTREKTPAAGSAADPDAFPAPGNLKAKILSPSTAWLQWTDPSLGRTQIITDDRYYNVHYQPLPSGKVLSVIVKALHVVLYDLVPGTNYLFKVRAVLDHAHSSPFSLAIQNRTFETVPTSAPRSVTVSPGNDSSMAMVAWRPPRQPNGQITAYLVMLTTRPKLSISRWEVRMITGQSAHALLQNLIPNTTYYLKVQAQNGLGYGPTSSTVAFTTPPASGGWAGGAGGTDSSSAAAAPSPTVYFPDADSSNSGASSNNNDDDGDYDDYEWAEDEEEEDWEEDERARQEQPRIVYAPAPSDDGTDHLLTTPDSRALEDELRGNQVAGFGGGPQDADREEASDWLIQSAPLIGERRDESEALGDNSGSKAARDVTGEGEPLQVVFQSVVKHTVSAVIAWREADCEGGGSATAARYVVRYRRADRPDAAPLHKATPTTFVIVDNLVPGARYEYRVRRVRADGAETGWSQPGVIDTAYPDRGRD